MSFAKMNLVLDTAKSLSVTQRTMTGGSLAVILNRNGHITSYGTPYQGGRGTYRLIRLTYDWCQRNGDLMGAEMVAKSFVNARGRYAYPE